MNPIVNTALDLVFRWTHVIAGVLWIGHLWFFNFVNAQLVKTLDADSKKKVVPALLPRALYFFRWGAAYTYLTGVLLLGIVYYHGGAHVLSQGPLGSGKASAVAFLALLVGFAVYEQLAKAIQDERVFGAVAFVLIAAFTFGLSLFLSGRSTIMHVGALFGTIMAANVWMRIWPSQRKILAGLTGAAAAVEPSVNALATLRSKHNTYLSMPLLFTMVASHFPLVYTSELAWLWMMAVVAIGWGLAKVLYVKSASAAVARF